MTDGTCDDIDELLARRNPAEGPGPLRVLWDFDGVVADTEPLHDQTYQELARRRSHPLEPGYFDRLLGRTEQSIWVTLIDLGFPADLHDVDALMRERQEVYLRLALETLDPTWVATTLVPHFAARGAEQFIVSNGDPDSQLRLLEKWRLSDSLTINRRAPGEDKATTLLRLCVPPVVVLEDNGGYLETARKAGAMTVAVRNGYNASQDLDADLVLSLLP